VILAKERLFVFSAMLNDVTAMIITVSLERLQHRDRPLGFRLIEGPLLGLAVEVR